MEKFNFVIARPWGELSPYPESLCTYAYESETFFGDIEYARLMREFINKKTDDDEKYDIYKINPEPIK